jgi:hypothetical protein
MHPGTDLLSRRKGLLLLGAGPFCLKAQKPTTSKSDLFPEFLGLWTESAVISPAERADRFVQLVVKPHIELFDAFVGDVSIERATRYIRQVEPLVPIIRSLHSWVVDGFDAHVAAFQKKIPDFAWHSLVVFMPNLFGFDAGGGPIGGEDVLVVGLDTIARIDGAHADLSVLIAHELFHKYHASFHPEWAGQSRGNDIPLYRLIWIEGLATCASQQLNPGAPLNSVLRSATLSTSCEEHLISLADLLLRTLDSTRKEPFMEWMSARTRSSDVPPRAGYYFGWRVAAVLGQGSSLREMARLRDEDVHTAILRELQKLTRG